MTGKYNEKRERKATSVLAVVPMKAADTRTKEKHGYEALRVSLNIKGKERIKEIRTTEQMEPGTEIKFEDIVKPGDKVNITGTSKGHGFAGVVKRHHFKGGPRTHGQSDRERAPGSSGSTTTPGRVYKGKRRAGHMGVETVTVRNLRVLEVDPEKHLVTIVGAVPGANGSTLLTIKKI